MQHLLRVSDDAGRHQVVLSLDEQTAGRQAVDVVFDVLGTESPDQLVKRGALNEGQVDDFRALQQLIFDRDAEGLFIRQDVNLFANGSELNPDAPISSSFVPAKKEGIDYRRCDLVIGSNAPPSSTGPQGTIEELSRLMLLHRIAMGTAIDVTKEHVELMDIINWAEKEGLIDIDVKKAAYKLTEKGKRMHDSYVEEAQNLILRYDIFGDVDVDSNEKAHFDSGLGKDLRVPVYELEGIDPYRARFLLGLNDGEWDHLENWTNLIHDENWYRDIFRPIENAPSVEYIGTAKLQNIINQGKEVLRRDSN